MSDVENINQFGGVASHELNPRWSRRVVRGLGLLATGAALVVYVCILMAIAPVVVSAAWDADVKQQLQDIFDQPMREPGIVNAVLSYRGSTAEQSFSR